MARFRPKRVKAKDPKIVDYDTQTKQSYEQAKRQEYLLRNQIEQTEDDSPEIMELIKKLNVVVLKRAQIKKRGETLKFSTMSLGSQMSTYLKF